MQMFFFELKDGFDGSLYWCLWSEEKGAMIGERGETSQHLLSRYSWFHHLTGTTKKTYLHEQLGVPELCLFLSDNDGFRAKLIERNAQKKKAART